MPNTTKAALEESLKRLLLKKPLDKITITDITTDCGISRMAFYYHFKDIYDLVEWSCLEDAKERCREKTYDTWQEGILQILKQFWKTSRLFSMHTILSAGNRLKIISFTLLTS